MAEAKPSSVERSSESRAPGRVLATAFPWEAISCCHHNGQYSDSLGTDQPVVQCSLGTARARYDLWAVQCSLGTALTL
ncbi:hypothetical protein ACOMHN_012197 [Nucella lapillus]